MHCAEIPEQRAATDPDRPCLEDSRLRLNSGQFAGAVRGMAAVLVRHGLGPGDVVGAMLPNRAELVLAMFAAWRLGAALTPINPALTADEVGYQLADSAAKLVLADETSQPRVAGAGVGILDVAELAVPDAAADAPPLRAQPSDIALLIYTSGTTGRPKGVVLDHGNLTAMANMIVQAFEMGPDVRVLLVLPLFHVNGIMASVVSPLRAGGSTAILPRFDPKTFWSAAERTRPTYFSAVPAIYAMLNALPPEVQPDTSSLQFAVCGAAPMPAEWIHEFERRYGVPIVEGYGLSEGSVASTINPVHGVRKPGTVGLPFPGQQVRVVDDADNPLPAGEVGEVVVRGPNVMRGYLGRPEETATTLRGGWLHTGDVGYLDQDGYLVLVDRKKDMIIRGGENIYPKEIEDVLTRHPAVLEVAVVGRPHPVYGEEPVAYVALHPDVAATPQQLVEHCQASLARFKVPRTVFIQDALPKNALGKVLKGQLREMVTAES